MYRAADWSGLHQPASPPLTPLQAKSPNAAVYHAAPEHSSPAHSSSSPTTAARGCDNFTVEELSDGDHAHHGHMEVLHPDELEEYRSEDNSDAASSPYQHRQRLSFQREVTDYPDSDTAVVARRLRRLRAREPASPSAALTRQRYRRAESASSTVRKRTHSESMSTTPEADCDRWNSQELEGSAARRLRRRVRGPVDYLPLPPSSPSAATFEEVMSDAVAARDERTPSISRSVNVLRHLEPDLEAMDIDSSPPVPAA